VPLRSYVARTKEHTTRKSKLYCWGRRNRLEIEYMLAYTFRRGIALSKPFLVVRFRLLALRSTGCEICCRHLCAARVSEWSRTTAKGQGIDLSARRRNAFLVIVYRRTEGGKMLVLWLSEFTQARVSRLHSLWLGTFNVDWTCRTGGSVQ